MAHASSSVSSIFRLMSFVGILSAGPALAASVVSFYKPSGFFYKIPDSNQHWYWFVWRGGKLEVRTHAYRGDPWTTYTLPMVQISGTTFIASLAGWFWIRQPGSRRGRSSFEVLPTSQSAVAAADKTGPLIRNARKRDGGPSGIPDVPI